MILTSKTKKFQEIKLKIFYSVKIMMETKDSEIVIKKKKLTFGRVNGLIWKLVYVIKNQLVIQNSELIF